LSAGLKHAEIPLFLARGWCSKIIFVTFIHRQ
jgi:hypothetical protein